MISVNLLWLLLPIGFVALLVYARRRQAGRGSIQRLRISASSTARQGGARRAKREKPQSWTPGEGLSKQEHKDKMKEMYQAQKFILKHKELIDETTELVLVLWALQEIYQKAGKSFSLDLPEVKELLTGANLDVALVAQQQFEIGYKNCSRHLLNPRILDNPDARMEIMERVKRSRKKGNKAPREIRGDEVEGETVTPENVEAAES